MNLPGAVVDLPTLTEKDEDDLIDFGLKKGVDAIACLLYTSPSPRDRQKSRMPSSA